MPVYHILKVEEKKFLIARDRTFLWWTWRRYHNYWAFSEWVIRISAAQYFVSFDLAKNRVDRISGEAARKEDQARKSSEIVWSSNNGRTLSNEEELTFRLGEAIRAENYEMVDLIMAELKTCSHQTK